MKQTMRILSVLALLMCSMIAWADDRVIIVAPTNGTVTVDNANPTGAATVTLTVTPTAGQYYITLGDIKVEKTASTAQTRTDGPAIVGTIAVAEATVDDTGKGTYTFSLPDGYGAKVTATFTECATFTPTISITSWTYGSAANDPVVSGNTSSGTETITYSIKDANSYSATVPTAANDYTVKVSLAAKGHYKAAEATTNFTIAKKDITISGIKAKNKEYDGGTTATLDYTSVVFTGIEDGDALTVSTTGTFEDASLGEGKTVTLGTLTLGGTSVSNYQLATTGQQTSTTANITQAVLKAETLNSKITLSSTSIGYTGEPVAPTVTIDGMTEGTDYDVKYKNGDAEATTTKPTNNGTYTIVIVGKGNYSGEVVTSKTFLITKAAAAVATAPTAKTGLVENGEFQELITAGSATNGTMQYSLDNKTYSTAIPKGKDAGTYTVYYKVVGNANYADTEAKTLSVTIAEAQSNILDASKHFTIGSYTFYELTTEALAAIKNTIKANVALSSAADSRTRVTDDGGLCFSKGEDIYMAVRNLKRHDVVIVVFTGTLYGDSYHLEKKNGTRSVGDMLLESGVEYDVITAGDMILTIKPREVEVNIKSIIIKSAPSTAIDGVEADNNTDRWFDLNGIPIDQPLKKGIYIKNGKKVIYK